MLPISAVSTHGLSPATWGFLVIINPAMVTFFQLRLTRRVEHFPAAPRLVLAMLLMGLPFLLLTVSGSLAVFGVVILMGAFGSTAAAGFALGPFIGLQLRDAGGDGAMWSFFAAISIVAAVTGAIACRFAVARRGRDDAAGAPASASA